MNKLICIGISKSVIRKEYFSRIKFEQTEKERGIVQISSNDDEDKDHSDLHLKINKYSYKYNCEKCKDEIVFIYHQKQ